MQIFLTTLNPGTYTFFDLGDYSVTHPIGPIPLIEPVGEFTEEDIQLSDDLLAAVTAGDIQLTNEGGAVLTTLGDLQTADPGLFVHLSGNESVDGIKTFNDPMVIGDAGLASPYLLSIQDQDNDGFAYIEILTDRTASTFGGTNKGAFFGMEDNGNSFAQQEFTLYNWQGGPIVFYTETSASAGTKRFQIENDGTLSIPSPGTLNYELLVTNDDDIPNKKYVDDAIGGLFLDAWGSLQGNTGTASPGGPGATLNIIGGTVGGIRTVAVDLSPDILQIDMDLTNIPTVAIDSANDFLIFQDVSDSGNVKKALASSIAAAEVNDLTSNVTWANIPDANVPASAITQHVGAINHDSLLGFVASEHVDWTADQGATNISAANIELAIDDLTDVDTTTVVPTIGEALYWDGTNFVPSNGYLSLNTDGCSIITTDDTGLDWCNFQVGAAGSAFTVLKKANGTIATPTVLNATDKIGGWGFIAFDDATSNPGYVSAEIQSFATETQSATNGGAEMRFLVTANGSKTPTTAFHIEQDGTLNVGIQTDYELKVTDDDDIPNKKYVDDQLAVDSELPTIAVRRTSSLNPIPTAWADFDWDIQDVSSADTSVLEYTGTPADEVTITEAGLYLISWAISADDECDVRLTNNGGVIPGSFHSTGDKADTNQILTGNEKTIARNLAAGTLVLQIQATTTAEFTIADSATLTVVRLKGAKGSDGPAGADGPAGFGVYAWATTTAGAVISEGLGLSVAGGGTGLYTYTFDTPVSSNTYAVFTQAIGQNQNDVEAEVYNKTTTGFIVRTNQQDDGGGTGVNFSSDHSVTIIGPNNGLPSGPANTINITPLANPKSTLNFDLADFTVADNGTNQADIGIIDKSIFSIIRVESTGADQANNYNTTTLQPLVLTGTVLNLGTATTDFTNASGTITCNFDGAIKVSYAVPHFTAGARESMKTTIQLNNADYSPAAYGYIRDSNGHRRDNNTGDDVVSVSNGDTIRIGIIRAEDSTAGAAVTLETRCTIIIERIN